MAYAQLEQQAAVDSWSEALSAAQSKVEAATPGAFGHGVPGLHNPGFTIGIWSYSRR